MNTFEFMGRLISLKYIDREKKTVILLDGEPVADLQLADSLGVTTSDIHGFLHSDDCSKSFSVPAPLGSVKIRLLCLLGYAGASSGEKYKVVFK